MDASTYDQLKRHTANMRNIIDNLEMSIDLAQRLGSFKLADLGDDTFSLVDADAEITGATAENVQRMVDHIDILSGIIEQARERVLNTARLLHLEVRFAQTERTHAAQRSAGKGGSDDVSKRTG